VPARRGCVRGYLYARYVRARYLLGVRGARVLGGATGLLLLGGVLESARVRGGAREVAPSAVNTSLGQGPEHNLPTLFLEKPVPRASEGLAAPACATAASLRAFGAACQRLYNGPGAVSPQYLCAQAYLGPAGPAAKLRAVPHGVVLPSALQAHTACPRLPLPATAQRFSEHEFGCYSQNT